MESKSDNITELLTHLPAALAVQLLLTDACAPLSALQVKLKIGVVVKSLLTASLLIRRIWIPQVIPPHARAVKQLPAPNRVPIHFYVSYAGFGLPEIRSARRQSRLGNPKRLLIPKRP
jgi:hypothetical protein